jgi:16S rRNA (cytidine1402-2'-O)-methyltransferase
MGNLYVVATPIGNLSDMTERAIETLKGVSYVLCEDTRTSTILLKHFSIDKRLVSYHKFNENSRVDSIIKDLKNGKDIALISDAGTPCINDPGYVIVKACRDNKIPVYGVGGISAFVTTLSISGLDTSSFTFYGFFPREKKEQTKLFEEIKSSSVNTYVFYESPKRIIKSLELLEKEFPNLLVSVSKELTKIHEKNYYGKITDVLKKMKSDEKVSAGEYTFVIQKDFVLKEEFNISIEAMLIDLMAKEQISLKDAVGLLNQKESNISKKEIYNASLSIKKMFE